MPRAPRQLPPLPAPNRATPTAGANSGLDKTWGVRSVETHHQRQISLRYRHIKQCWQGSQRRSWAPTPPGGGLAKLRGADHMPARPLRGQCPAPQASGAQGAHCGGQGSRPAGRGHAYADRIFIHRDGEVVGEQRRHGSNVRRRLRAEEIGVTNHVIRSLIRYKIFPPAGRSGDSLSDQTTLPREASGRWITSQRNRDKRQ